MKLVLVFCEGPHDVAFVSRVLRASASFVPYEGTLGELPEPLSRFLIKREQSRAIDALDIKKSTKAVLPTLWEGMRTVSGNTLVLFFSCFGQDQHKAVGRFISGFRTLLAASREQGQADDIDKLGVAFLYDADDDGVAKKLAVWKQRYASYYPELASPESGKWTTWKDERVGWYVFRAPGGDTGQLEDIVLPLLRGSADSTHEAARQLVEGHWPSGESSVMQRKATITVAGQVSHPGSSMAVILAETLHLNDQALQSDVACKEILGFFTAASLGEPVSLKVDAHEAPAAR